MRRFYNNGTSFVEALTKGTPIGAVGSIVKKIKKSKRWKDRKPLNEDEGAKRPRTRNSTHSRTQIIIIWNLFMPIYGRIIFECWTEECTNCSCTSPVVMVGPPGFEPGTNTL